jgi:signal transduction histidine kinase
MRNLAHELATPLTPLVGYLKLFKSGRLGALTEQQQQVIAAMTHASERLEHSIDNLVDYASIEGGKYRVMAAEFDASALVEQCINELQAKARAKHVRVDVRKPGHVVLIGDSRKLRQALANVLDNAVRVSPHGGQLLMELNELPDRVTFAVYDQGPGIPPEVQRLAEGGVLLRADERAGNAGLGLPVTIQIATAHGGGLTLESPPREQPDLRNLYSGSRVGFWIPRVIPPPPA